MFAALLGYNPIKMLLGPTLSQVPASHAAYLTGHSFFPSLISAPFSHGLQIAFDFSIACCLVAAVASLLRGRHYVHDMHAASDAEVVSGAVAGEAAALGAAGAAGLAASANGELGGDSAALHASGHGTRPNHGAMDGAAADGLLANRTRIRL